MSSVGKIQSYPGNPRVAKVNITAAYSGLEVDFEAIDLANGRTPEFYNKFPLGKVPVFESPQVNLFESSAIAFYVASLKPDNPILGKTVVEKTLIIGWILFAENEIHTPTSGWVGPLRGTKPYFKPSVDAAAANLKRGLTALDKNLLTKTYLVGEEVTFADIAVATSLINSYKFVFDKTGRSQFKNVTRYFNTLVNKPIFKKFLGEIQLCETPLKYNPSVKKPHVKQAQAEDKKSKVIQEKSKIVQEKEEEEPEPAPKVKSKLDLLPPSPFVLDAWKREYSNNDTKDAIKWFWENFDAEGYSIWKVDYKYNDELTLTFMSNNLIGGFYARLERAHKYAFGSLIVRGENNNNNISGYFVVRGQEIPFEIYDAADFNSFNFQKIEPLQYEEKKQEFYKYLAWEFDDFVDGKVFK